MSEPVGPSPSPSPFQPRPGVWDRQQDLLESLLHAARRLQVAVRHRHRHRHHDYDYDYLSGHAV